MLLQTNVKSMKRRSAGMVDKIDKPIDETTETKAAKPKKQLIFIVDDVPKNLQVLGNILRKSNYSVSAATNGKHALEMLTRLKPDLILLDIMMPEMDGFEVCEHLKSIEATSNIPVIFLTARTQTSDIVRGFELGAVDYITKPFNRSELLARVGSHLELRRAQNEIIHLEQKNAALAMAVTANHEINQPLTTLQGNFELLQKTIENDGASEKQERFISKVQSSIDRIQGILQKFMENSRIHFEEYVGDQKQVIFDENE